jgi:hypothetical protein
LEYSGTKLQWDSDGRRSEAVRIVDLSRCIQERNGSLVEEGSLKSDGQSSLRCLRRRHSIGETPRIDLDRRSTNRRELISVVHRRRVIKVF